MEESSGVGALRQRDAPGRAFHPERTTPHYVTSGRMKMAGFEAEKSGAQATDTAHSRRSWPRAEGLISLAKMQFRTIHFGSLTPAEEGLSGNARPTCDSPLWRVVADAKQDLNAARVGYGKLMRAGFQITRLA
jgi:hypothetical protein